MGADATAGVVPKSEAMLGATADGRALPLHGFIITAAYPSRCRANVVEGIAGFGIYKALCEVDAPLSVRIATLACGATDDLRHHWMLWRRRLLIIPFAKDEDRRELVQAADVCEREGAYVEALQAVVWLEDEVKILSNAVPRFHH